MMCVAFVVVYIKNEEKWEEYVVFEFIAVEVYEVVEVVRRVFLAQGK